MNQLSGMYDMNEQYTKERLAKEMQMASTKPVSAPKIHAVWEAVEAEAGRLHERLTQLEQRLRPVLSPRPEGCTASQEKVGNLSPFGESILMHHTRLRDAIARVDNLIDGLEV